MRAGRFPCMQMKTSLFLSCVLLTVSAVASAQAPPTPATPPAQTTPPAPGHARARHGLHADAIDRAGKHRAEGCHHGSKPGTARRQAGEIRRRAMSAPRHRSGDAGSCPRQRQHAGDPAAGQPRRRPQRPAEIAANCNDLAAAERLRQASAGLLDRSSTGFLYAARSRLRHERPRRRAPWRGSSAG